MSIIMEIRPISKALEKVAIDELHEDPASTKEHLQHLQEWLKVHTHLNVKQDDQFLIAFLRGCKWDISRTKKKIECYCTSRSVLPSVFLNRDPLDPLIQKMLESGIIYPLPNTEGSGGPRIIYSDCTLIDFGIMKYIDLNKFLFLLLELLMMEDDNFVIGGYLLLVNLQNIPFSVLLQITPLLAKRLVNCWQNGYPLRVKGVIGINTPFIVVKVYNILMKPFLSKKIQSRTHLLCSDNLDKAYALLPKHLFPKEFGGENGGSKAKKEFRRKMESYKDWFLDDFRHENIGLRPSSSKHDTVELPINIPMDQID